MTLESRIRKLEGLAASPDAAEEAHEARVRALMIELGFATAAEIERPFDFMDARERFLPFLRARAAAQAAGLPIPTAHLSPAAEA